MRCFDVQSVKSTKLSFQTSDLPFALVIPTYNAGENFKLLLEDISRQSLQPDFKLIIDSASSDGTADIAKGFAWQTLVIDRAEFSHGGTRQRALEMLPEHVELVIFLTQDVRIDDIHALAKLMSVFLHPDNMDSTNSTDSTEVAAAYGRQIPHKGASVYAAVDREFNYPPKSRIKGMEDSRELGIKTAFLSDSFAVYRVADLKQIGGFPYIDICEDMYVAGKLLLAGKKIAYVAEAEVRHSHEPDIIGIWQRYKDMGRFQKENPWLRESFGGVGGEGMKLVKYQLKRVIAEKGICSMLKILFLDVVKLFAYRFGLFAEKENKSCI